MPKRIHQPVCVRPSKFFRLRLLTLDNESIIDLLDRLDRESKALKEDLLNICWFMRGSISYDEAMQLSFDDRELIGKIIKRNMETTKESGMPFF